MMYKIQQKSLDVSKTNVAGGGGGTGSSSLNGGTVEPAIQ